MTIFIKRSMPRDEVTAVQSKIERLAAAMGAPYNLMAFSASNHHDPANDDVFIGLPLPTLLPMFPGYTRITEADLPYFMTTLLVREEGFAEFFPEIAKKRRSRP